MKPSTFVISFAALVAGLWVLPSPLSFEGSVLAGEAEGQGAGSKAAPDETVKTVGHCAQTTKAYFSCSFKNGKLVSLCGDGKKGDLQYLFGKPGAVELSWPEKAQGGLKKFEGKAINLVSASGDMVRFTNGVVTYEVSSLAGAGGENAEANNFVGVTVVKGEKTVATLTCEDVEVDKLAKLRSLISP